MRRNGTFDKQSNQFKCRKFTDDDCFGTFCTAMVTQGIARKKIFDYYEVKDNYVIFYFTTLKKNSEKSIALYLKAEVAGNYEAPKSPAYLYNTNEYKKWAGGERIVIERP